MDRSGLGVWRPDREALASLWEYATEYGIDFSLDQVPDYGSLGETESSSTQNQPEAILRALEMGYFEEPREATLIAVAAVLGISQLSGGGFLRRGIKRLVVSTVAVDVDETADETET